MARYFTLSRRSVLLLGSSLILANCAKGGLASSGLRVGIANSPDSLDPAQGQTASAALLFKQLFTPLTNYGENGELAAGLAKTWTMSDDGLQWTFTLRQGLQWSDGQPITANDIVTTVRDMLDPSSTYADAGDFFQLKNAAAVLAGDKAVVAVGVEAITPLIVQFHFEKPLGVFAELMREFYPVPAHVSKGKPDQWPLPPQFVGSGPYILAKASHMELQLKRNPLAPDPAQIENVYVSVVEDAATRARMLRAGDLDLTEDPPSNQIVSLKARENVALYGWKSPRIVYLKINHHHPALQDIKVRTALNMTVDRTFIAEQLFEGFAEEAIGIFPWAAKPLLDPLPQRIEKAKQLLDEAGFAGGLTLTLLHSGGERERIAVALAENWKAIGVKCHLQATDGQGLYAFIDAGDFDLAMASFDRGLKRENWRMVEPFASGGFAANFNWKNAQYDALVEQTRTEPNAVQRGWLAAEAADLLHEQAAIIPLVFERKFWLASPNLKGFSSEIPPDQWRFLSWA